MNRTEAEQTVRRVLAGIAPEADLDTLPPDVELQEELDLDSMDFLNFTIGLAEALGLDIPERDGRELTTFAGCVAYVERRTS